MDAFKLVRAAPLPLTVEPPILPVAATLPVTDWSAVKWLLMLSSATLPDNRASARVPEVTLDAFKLVKAAPLPLTVEPPILPEAATLPVTDWSAVKWLLMLSSATLLDKRESLRVPEEIFPALRFVSAAPLPLTVAPPIFPDDVTSPVTPRLPPTVALLVIAAEFSDARPDVETVERFVAPVTPSVPPIATLPLMLSELKLGVPVKVLLPLMV